MITFSCDHSSTWWPSLFVSASSMVVSSPRRYRTVENLPTGVAAMVTISVSRSTNASLY